MRVLLIDAYTPDDPDRDVVDVATETLVAGGHSVKHLRLTDEFSAFMSEDEWVAYHGCEPLISNEARTAAAAVRASDALLFCHRTELFMVPAVLKGWLERVLVPGVAFVFNHKGRVARGMTNIVRIGMITTTPHSAWQTRLHRDLPRRTLLRTMGLNCHRFVRRTHIRLRCDSTYRRPIVRKLRRW